MIFLIFYYSIFLTINKLTLKIYFISIIQQMIDITVKDLISKEKH